MNRTATKAPRATSNARKAAPGQAKPTKASAPPVPQDGPTLIGIAEAAKILRRQPRTVLRQAHAGFLKMHRFGRAAILYDKAQVEELARQAGVLA